MYCLECSTENSEDNKYCKECGVPLQIASVTSALPALPSATEKQHQLQRLLDLAFWHTQSGNTDAAITSCRAALSLKPDSTTALSLLGCLYEKKGRDEEAIEAFEQVVSLIPTVWPTHKSWSFFGRECVSRRCRSHSFIAGCRSVSLS